MLVGMRNPETNKTIYFNTPGNNILVTAEDNDRSLIHQWLVDIFGEYYENINEQNVSRWYFLNREKTTMFMFRESADRTLFILRWSNYVEDV